MFDRGRKTFQLKMSEIVVRLSYFSQTHSPVSNTLKCFFFFIFKSNLFLHHLSSKKMIRTGIATSYFEWMFHWQYFFPSRIYSYLLDRQLCNISWKFGCLRTSSPFFFIDSFFVAFFGKVHKNGNVAYCECSKFMFLN